jgi:hypothetical protein
MIYDKCQEAAKVLYYEGVVCRQAGAMTACDIPNRPGVYRICPVFN